MARPELYCTANRINVLGSTRRCGVENPSLSLETRTSACCCQHPREVIPSNKHFCSQQTCSWGLETPPSRSIDAHQLLFSPARVMGHITKHLMYKDCRLLQPPCMTLIGPINVLIEGRSLISFGLHPASRMVLMLFLSLC